MEFKIVIPPTGEEYKANDINSVRAYFILAYKKLIREGKMTNETVRCADVLIYTPDYCLGYCQYEG